MLGLGVAQLILSFPFLASASAFYSLEKQPTASFPSSRMTLVVFFKDLAFTLAIVGHPSAAKEPGHRRTMVTHGNGLIMFT